MIEKRKVFARLIIIFMILLAPLDLDIALASSDTTPPVFTSIEVDNNQVTGGDKVKVTVEASDEESGIKAIQVVYKYSSSQDAEGLQLLMNETTGKYEGTIDVNGRSLNLNGKWELLYISILDNSENTLRVQGNQEDFSHTNLYVSNNDVTPPVLQGIEVEEKQVETGDVFRVTVEATDSESGIGDVVIKYLNEDRINEAIIELIYNNNTGEFEGSFPIDETTVGGRWLVDRVTIYDQNQNVIYLDNKVTQPYDPNAVDLSYADFYVVDTAPPIVRGVESGGYYDEDVTIEFNEGVAYLRNSTQGGSIWNGTVVSDEDSYTLEVTDLAGNKTTVNFIIDKTAPVISGISSGVAYNRDISPVFNEGTGQLNGGEFHSGTAITEEGYYTLNVKDQAGNESSVEFAIDKTGPKVNGVKPDGVYFTNVIPTFNEGIGLLDGKPFYSGTNVVEEGRHVLVVSDEAENHTIVVFTIDRTAPNVWGVTEGSYYNHDVAIDFNEGIAKLNGNPIVTGDVVNKEGSYELLVSDQTGNETKIHFTIDKTAPEIEGLIENHYYNIDLTPTFNEGTATLNGNEFTSGSIIEEEGKYLLEVKDKAGNMSILHFIIDKTAPEVLAIDKVTEETQSITGKTESGAAVLVKSGSTILSTVQADQDGNFILEIPKQEGNSKLIVITKDIAGNESTPFSISVEKIEPINKFTDLTLYQEEINYLSSKGIITGYSDNTFRPEEPIKRIQAVKMILREMGVNTNASPDPGLSDMKSGTYGYEEVAKAVELGFVSGKNNGAFDPFGTLTRGQMAKILVKAYHLKGDIKTDFYDVKEGHWAYDFVNTLAAQNITTGYDDHTFRPNQQISRQHFSVFMARYLDEKFK